MNGIQIAGLLGLAMLIPVYQGARNWREQKFRWQMAAVRGWRYSNRGLKGVFTTSFSVAGSMPSGAVWHLRREQRDQQWFYVWTCSARSLPFGTLAILPRFGATFPNGSRYPSLRPIPAGGVEWQGMYMMMATHDILVERCFNQEVEFALLDWPDWPEPGALENVTWDSERLTIYGRYQNDWLVLDRMVALGTALIENVVQ